MMHRRLLALVAPVAVVVAVSTAERMTGAGSLPSPDQFIGFKVGADNKLVRWDKIVEYMKLAAAGSDRVHLRELGKSTGGNAFLALEISSPDTIRNLDRYRQYSRKLYFQDGAPSTRD